MLTFEWDCFEYLFSRAPAYIHKYVLQNMFTDVHIFKNPQNAYKGSSTAMQPHQNHERKYLQKTRNIYPIPNSICLVISSANK